MWFKYILLVFNTVYLKQLIILLYYITKCLRQASINNRNVFPHSCKSKIEVPVVLIRAGVLTGCLFSVCSHSRMGEVALWYLFYIGTNPLIVLEVPTF